MFTISIHVWDIGVPEFIRTSYQWTNRINPWSHLTGCSVGLSLFHFQQQIFWILKKSAILLCRVCLDASCFSYPNIYQMATAITAAKSWATWLLVICIMFYQIPSKMKMLVQGGDCGSNTDGTFCYPVVLPMLFFGRFIHVCLVCSLLGETSMKLSSMHSLQDPCFTWFQH